MANLALAFDILARDKASKTFDHVGKASEGLGSKLGKLGKGALLGIATGGALAAVGGIAAVGTAMVQGVKDAAAYQTLAQKTAAVLKSTGDASRQSVKGIQARAAALESMSGIDETTIINGQNVLATFTKIRDGVGKGNDIFNQATTAALNMSTALGQDMQSSVVQLGKALNDPIKGVTALSRVGVSFTAQQKDQIKTLVKSGNTLKAQKIILKELNTEFGGAAKAAGKGFEGSMARAKDAVDDAFRSIGMKLLPVLTKVADYVATHAGPIIDRLSNAFSGLYNLFVKGDFTSAFRNAFHVDEDSKAVDFLFRLREGFIAVVGFIRTKVIPAIVAFGGWLKNDLWPALVKGYQTIMPGLKQALSILQSAFKGTGKGGSDFTSILKSLGQIVTTVVIPVLSFVIRYILPAIASNIRNTVIAVKILSSWFQTLATVTGTVFTAILRGFAGVTSAIGHMLQAVGHIKGFGWAKTAGDLLVGAAKAANGFADALNRVKANSTITVNTYYKTHGSPPAASGKGGNVTAHARGGPVYPGGVYAVGDNPDGSWNPTTELFVSKTAGTIYNQKALRGMGGGKVSLDMASIHALAAVLSDVQTHTTITAGSVDAAIGGRLR